MWFRAGLVGVFALAVATRLAGSLRGAGLYGLGNYDDGVHFAAALGLVNGLLPYRDFLLLHPPGIVLALSPFAALSWAIGEPNAMAVARLTWMALGGLNAVLCALVLRPLGRMAGLVAALAYALSIGAVYDEHTTLLEPLATSALLAAMVITRLLGDGGPVRMPRYLIAGLLLGLSPTIKIWGVVPVLAVVITIMVRRGRRPGILTLAGALASCTLICAPFFLLAPRQMWQMVVVAQLSRRRVETALPMRLGDILGTREWGGQRDHWGALLVVALLLVLASLLVCLARAELRVLAVLLITHVGLVLAAPMWFLHYAGLTAAPLALVVGAGAGALRRRTMAVPWLTVVSAALVPLGLLALAVPLLDVSLGRHRLPTAPLGSALATRAGCVTTDYPMALIQLDQLQRQIDRDCPYVVDLGGYSYYLTDSADHGRSRRRNADWQQLALTYFRSGDAVIIVRFSTASGFAPATAQEIESWPVIIRSGRYLIRQPMVAPKTSPSR